MGKLVAVVCLALLLSCGGQSFTMSEKDYESAEKMLEFGAQVFLNWLDKVRDVTERMVRENQLRTTRIAIQGHWNSFKETANRISVEERGKGVQDDMIVAARTIRRLLLFYKDDLQKMIRSLATQKGVQHYLPAVNMLEGVIQKEQWNEVWGAVESHYLPGAPSVRNDPFEFLCYLLSTSTVETFIVNILKNGADVISQIRHIDFQKLQESALNHSRFWEKMNKMVELIRPVVEADLTTEAFWLYLDYFNQVFIVALEIAFRTVQYIDHGRARKNERALNNVALLVFTPIWVKLDEMDAVPVIETLYYRASNICLAVVGEEELETFKGEVMERWKPFKEEASRVILEERAKTAVFLLPEVRACARLFSNYSKQLINEIIDDSDRQELAKNLEQMRKICTEKLLASGLITQEKLKESERVFEEAFFEFSNFMDEQGMRDSLWTLNKASLVLLNWLYSSLLDTWNFISV
uniref:Exocyst complex component Sec6 n=1 Tax=Pygocentrus nattereri TaxID=42514 RepID=A0A3B4BZK5_PYGNA